MWVTQTCVLFSANVRVRATQSKLLFLRIRRRVTTTRREYHSFIHPSILPNYHNSPNDPRTQRHISCTSTQIDVGRRRLRGLNRRREEAVRKTELRNILGLGDRRFWNDEQVETAVWNGSERNKPISTRAQKANASGFFVVMLQCD